MKLHFSKYHGTGNDFIMFDNRGLQLDTTDFLLFKKLCSRRFGIGADGVIFVQNHPDYDFEMVYLNADGKPSSMCGNGGRCVVTYAASLGIIENKAVFLAIDGDHHAEILENGAVTLKMIDTLKVDETAGNYVLNTGSPHYVKFTNDLASVDVYEEGKAIRQSPPYRKEGINVNFVEETEHGLSMSTFERGVENITYSCGTGVVACSIAAALKNGKKGTQTTQVTTRGGQLSVLFTRKNEIYTNVWLTGPVKHVFDGTISV